MEDITISKMMEHQMALWERHKETWSPMEPVFARNSLLWMMEEFGEVVAVIKKKGEQAIMEDVTVRQSIVTEFVDVAMYMIDAMLRYKITPKEFVTAFEKKADENLLRDYDKQYQTFLSASQDERD